LLRAVSAMKVTRVGAPSREGRLIGVGRFVGWSAPGDGDHAGVGLRSARVCLWAARGRLQGALDVPLPWRGQAIIWAAPSSPWPWSLHGGWRVLQVGSPSLAPLSRGPGLVGWRYSESG